MEFRSQDSPSRIAQALAARGPLIDPEPVPAEIIARYEGRIPPLMLDFWEAQGIGGLGDGMIQLCVPDQFAAPLELLFTGDPLFAGRTHALAYGPFGSLIVWNESEWLGLMNHPAAMLDAPWFGRDKAGLDPDRIVLDHVLMLEPAVMDLFDDDGAGMYAGARKRLGSLAAGLIYGLMPPDSFEAVTQDALAVTEAEDWLAQRFAGQRYMVQDTIGGRLNIRLIGAEP